MEFEEECWINCDAPHPEKPEIKCHHMKDHIDDHHNYDDPKNHYTWKKEKK